MSHEIELVVFDLGRVLVRICDGWEHACSVAGVPGPAHPPDAETMRRLHELVCRSEVNEIDIDAFAEAAGPLLGIEPRHVIALSNAYLLGCFPGASEMLDDLNAAGIETACLSNTNANHWRIMYDPAGVHAPALGKLRHRFASHLVGCRKPDAAIYAHVEHETGVAASQILFFDDLGDNVKAAAHRGWTAVQIPSCDNPIPLIRGHLSDHLGGLRFS